MKTLLALAAAIIGLASPNAYAKNRPAQQSQTRPNFLIIVADDMGFSDLGAFGGEISTPNLDRLANDGLRLTNFYVAPTCSPTRAMLMTGRDQHMVGLGLMAEIPLSGSRPKGYEGFLTTGDTIAERLRKSGYATFISGKWHLGDRPGRWPEDRGFERSYVLHQGGGNHFGLDQQGAVGGSPIRTTYSRDGEWTKFPVGEYSADEFTNQMLGFLRDNRDQNRPFFAYLAFTQPHWPLQAHAGVIEHYRGMYDDGPLALRRARRARMAELGMVFGDDDVELIEGEQWDELSVEMRERAAREMEVYAAMVEEMDRNVGRIIEELTSQGTLEETVILFMSDNGASGSDWSEVRRIFAGMGVGPDLLADFDRANSNPSAIGAQDSFIVYGPQWAQAAMAPFRLYKGYTNEGGIKSAAFVRGPGIVHAQSSDALLSVRDIFPTLLDLAGLRPKASNKAGGARSWGALLSGREGAVRAGDDFIAMEFNGRRMIIRADGWKAVYSSATVRGLGGGTPSWQLFNLRNDPSEVSDLALSRPQILTELVAEWEKYARDNNIRADLLKK